MEGSKFNETRLMVHILGAVEGNHKASQRSIARDLGVALGLINAYFKRCVKKGLIKVSDAPASRYAYYLTPKGFAEKSRLTADYLSHSLVYFRQARQSCTTVLGDLAGQRSWRRVAFAGAGDLAEISVLCSYEQQIDVVAVIDPLVEGSVFVGVRLVADAADVTRRAAVVLDPFRGSGSTLIAAHKVGRAARLIEYDPLYCDVIVRRWEAFTGQPAINKSLGAVTGSGFRTAGD